MADETIEAIEVLGCVARRLTYRSAEAETPIGAVWVGYSRQRGWHAEWWPDAERQVRIDLGSLAASAQAAAAEATRRLRAIQCAALGEAIAVAEAWEMEPARNPLGAAWHEGAESARAAIVDDLRAIQRACARAGAL